MAQPIPGEHEGCLLIPSHPAHRRQCRIAKRRVLSEKGSWPTELGVVRPKTANVIGLLPIKEPPLDFAGNVNDKKEVVE